MKPEVFSKFLTGKSMETLLHQARKESLARLAPIEKEIPPRKTRPSSSKKPRR